MTRGEVYRVRLPPRRGREQAGPRYGVIVQAEQLLGLSTAIVAPTSRSAAPATFRPEIQLDGESTRVLSSSCGPWTSGAWVSLLVV